MKKLLIPVLIIWSCSPAPAQYLPFSSQVLVSSQGAKIGAFAIVTVCPSTGSGNPCFPKSTIYSNSSGTALANPFTADQQGNFTFYAPAGAYVITVNFGANNQSYAVTIGGTGGASCSGDISSGCSTVTGLQGKAVSSTSPTSNQVLQWNGTNWIPATISTGSGTVTHTAGNLTSNAAVFGNGSGDIKVDGSITTNGSGTITAVGFSGPLAGNAITATNLSSYPTLCAGGQFSQGLSSGSNNCATPSGGSGTPGSPSLSVQGNNAGSFFGIPGFNFAVANGALAAQPTADVVPLTISCFSGGSADCLDVKNAAGTKAFWVNSNGSLGFLGNNATYQDQSGSTQAWIKMYASSTAPAYFAFNASDGSHLTTITHSESIAGLVCIESVNPSGDCGATAPSGVGALKTMPTVTANLPACGADTEGTQEPVTDSDNNTWGSAVVHTTGSFHVLAYCDGSGWTVMAK